MKTNSMGNLLICLLALLGVGAIFGDGVLIISPSGRLFGMPLSMLHNSSFNNFLIPGIILFTVLGIMPIGVTMALIKKPANIICLCPNHHVMFDKAVFSIEPDLTLKGIDGRLNMHEDHKLGEENFAYHQEHIYING